MHGEGFFYQAFVYLTAAVMSVPVAKRLGLGSVLGYLIAGMIIGPFGLGLIGKEGQDVMHFAEFGVVMMLFLVGLELQPSLLLETSGPYPRLGRLAGRGHDRGDGRCRDGPGPGLADGRGRRHDPRAFLDRHRSADPVRKRAHDDGRGAELLCRSSLSGLAVIPMLAILPLLAPGGSSHGGGSGGTHAAGHGTTWVEGIPGWAETLVVLGAVSAIVLIGRFLLRPAFRWIAATRLRELFTAAALLLVIGIALLMTKVGLSPALGTFLAGVVLAESEYRHELESDIEPFKGLLLGVFFIAVGASIDFGLISARPGLMAGLVCALLAVKFLVLFVLGRLFRMGLDQNLLFAFALAQGGEFAFVLFSFATQQGVISGELANPLVAVVALSMAVTPVLMVMNEKLLQPTVGNPRAGETEGGPNRRGKPRHHRRVWSGREHRRSVPASQRGGHDGP